MSEFDVVWFKNALERGDKTSFGLAQHLEIHPSNASRLMNGKRKMKMHEATSIASFLGVPVSTVLRHAGVSTDAEGAPSRVLLAAMITATGDLKALAKAVPLPPSIVERAMAATASVDNPKIIAAQVRAGSGPLALFDDAVILFLHTTAVELSAIGSLAICRSEDGLHCLARIERARKTGEARILRVTGKPMETTLATATPVIAILP